MLAGLLTACDPTATRLTPKRLDFTYAAATRSFDAKGNLVLTGFNAPFVVRMNRETQTFQDLSQGLPDKGPSGEIFADAAGNLAARATRSWVITTTSTKRARSSRVAPSRATRSTSSNSELSALAPARR